MNGVLLVNMGGPGSSKEMRVFLSNMFKDPFILPFNKLTRYLLSFIISITRYRKSWKKYKLIGGTPIISATRKTVLGLQEKLGNEYKVKMGFSYTPPFISKSIEELKKEGVKKITIIPLYPQASHSTTSSVKAEVKKFSKKVKSIDIRFIKEFYEHEGFIKFWSELIIRHIAAHNYKHPFLLFSAHSIPEYMKRHGDTYPWAIGECSNRIAKKTGIAYEYTYQSGMKKGEWLKPDVRETLKNLAGRGIKEIVIVPISFVNENLETLYDIDYEIIPYAKNELGIQSISRVKIPEANDLFIQLLEDLVKK